MWRRLQGWLGGDARDGREINEGTAPHLARRGPAPTDEMARNLRFAWRSLIRNPVYSATFILTSALTVALGATAWAVGDTALWRGLPWPDADRLIRVGVHAGPAGTTPTDLAVDGATWEQLRDRGPALPAAVYSEWITGVNLSTDGAAAFVPHQRVGAGYFRTLGVLPAQGREFSPAEDVPDGPAVVVLGHDLWRTTFAADGDIVGSTVRLKGEPHTVVGVMPRGFRTPSGADVWTPLRPDRTGEGSGTNYAIVARMPDGATRSEMSAQIEALPVPEGWTGGGTSPRFGLIPMQESERRQRREPMRIVLGGVALMLLIGWSNLAGLQVARTLARGPELATRRALGGDRGALVRQMTVEHVLVGAIGGAVGTGAVLLGAPVVEAALETRFGSWQPFPGRGQLVGAAAIFTVLATLVAGLWPVVRAAASGGAPPGMSGGRIRGSRHRGRRLLLVGQLALVTVLVFGAGLLSRSYGHLNGLQPGFDPAGVYTASISLDDARYEDAAAVRALFDESLEALGRRPEVARAAVALTLPYERPLNLPFWLPGSDEALLANVVYVTPGYFETLRIPVFRGRVFDAGDGPGTGVVAVANRAWTERYLDGGDALGAVARMGGGLGEVPVVGVVGNVQQVATWGGVAMPVWETPTLYLAAAQLPSGFFQGIHVWFSPTWLVRGVGGTEGLAAATQEVFRTVAGDLPLARSGGLAEVVDRAFARERLEAVFLLLMAAFALVLAGVGLYGLVSQEVLERRGEMGVRMALGASPSEAVVRAGASGVRLVALGLALGAVLSIPAARLLERLVFGVGPWDPVTLAGVLGTLAVLAAVASFVPASRVGRLDPASVLRAEG